MAGIDNGYFCDQSDSYRNVPQPPAAPKKAKKVRTVEDNDETPSYRPQLSADNAGRPVPLIYNVAARRRLCTELPEPEILAVPLVVDAKAPRKIRRRSSIRSTRLSGSGLTRKPVVRRLFSNYETRN